MNDWLPPLKPKSEFFFLLEMCSGRGKTLHSPSHYSYLLIFCVQCGQKLQEKNMGKFWFWKNNYGIMVLVLSIVMNFFLAKMQVKSPKNGQNGCLVVVFMILKIYPQNWQEWVYYTNIPSFCVWKLISPPKGRYTDKNYRKKNYGKLGVSHDCQFFLFFSTLFCLFFKADGL